MSTVNEIRETFLTYFEKNDHKIVDSAPLVPLNDPTLLFTNAGMVQFKNLFTGLEQRSYQRAVTAQKVVRAGGKHNDLDNVGYTARHHTFFEMLGNFSFGNYFKDRAIELAWNLVTKEFGLPADRLLATVYDEDEEAFELWQKIAGLPQSRIIKISTLDNFWSMGATGPCGPCSEIFFDHGDHIPGGPPGSPDEDGDRFVEIWNLVFMQFEQVDDKTRVDLPKPSIDTGMGLERIAAVLQGTHDNYEIDLFKTLIERTGDVLGQGGKDLEVPSYKVIADHLRASAFLIADGVTPSNDGRGYVLRRIMRRGMRHAHLLGAKEPLMWQLVPTLVSEMGLAYPELQRAQNSIIEWLRLEEKSFRKTLERGIKLLDDEVGKLKPGQALSGETAFKLYDTFGFPVDLTQDALRQKNLGVDLEGFQNAMNAQKELARANWKGSGSAAIEQTWFDLRDQFGASEFLGYTLEEAQGQVLAIVKDGIPADKAVKGDEVAVIANQTPFYGEAGGQTGDQGVITSSDCRLNVTDTQKFFGDFIVHYATIEEGKIAPGTDIILQVSNSRRSKIRRAHSATHLMHAALRQRLGDHVAQKGSLVAPDRLRFDFSQPVPLTEEDIEAVEAEVNTMLRQNSAVSVNVMAIDDAIEAGAMALFGEKYGDEVRVVSMGMTGDDKVYSMELCGGTHVSRTGDIAFFAVTAESAVASGIRRIEALTGEAAYRLVAGERRQLSRSASLAHTRPDELEGRIRALLDDKKSLEAQLADMRKKLATGSSGTDDTIKKIGDISYLGKIVEGLPAKELRNAADTMAENLGSGIVVLVAVNDGKGAIVVKISQDLEESHDAVALVRTGIAAMGGKGGGGRRNFAQGGGPDGHNATQALEAVEKAVSNQT